MGSARNRFSSRASCPAKLLGPVYQLSQVGGNTYDSSSLLCSLACIRVFKVLQVFLVSPSNGVPSSYRRPSSLLSVIDVGVADSFAVQSLRSFDVHLVSRFTTKNEWENGEGRKKVERTNSRVYQQWDRDMDLTCIFIRSHLPPPDQRAASELKYPRRPPRTSGVHVVPRIGTFACRFLLQGKEREGHAHPDEPASQPECSSTWLKRART